MSVQKPDRAALRRARDLMLERGEFPLGYLVSTLLARSWRRSVDAGLAPDGRLADVYRLDDAELARTRENQHELIAHARPVMEYLHAQTRDSGSMVTLADEKGVLLQALGDPDFLTRADRVALSPGTSWHERHRGTNAIGTALAEARPLVVHGGEHFLERNGFLSCAAAPLVAPDGKLLGVLDISGDERQHHPHTFGLVRTAAQMVENRLFDACHAHNLRIRFHTMAEGIGTFSEGIAALSEDGWLIGANPAGLAFLGLRAGDLNATPLSRILPLRFEDLLNWNRRHPGEPLLITLADGERLFMRIEPPMRVAPAAAPVGERRERTRDALDALDTGDERLATAIDKAHKLVGKPIPLLLQGEPGVGKERFARAVHDSGPRHDGPFVTVHCSGLLPNLVEAELFGYAATLCRDGAPGHVREADGGTLFIDEVELLPLPAQKQLLKVLTERRVTPVAANESVAVDIVLICATHSNLKAAIDAGDFDADFYYRINGVTLQLAPLRERQDFPALVAGLLEELAPDRGISLDPAVATAFAEYSWPGNLRQLNNALRAAIALLDEGETRIGWNHLPDDLAEELRWRVTPTPVGAGEETENLRELSQATMERAIALSRGNMSEAARRLGISRNTLYRRLRAKQTDDNGQSGG
jgi:transcriptional regulator of acetoin/glycerol metabolism